MKIAIGADHGGFELKAELINFLKEKSHDVIDVGTYAKESCDYPEFGIKTAEAVRDKKADYGILICRSGIGMSLVANKVKGVRAALCVNEKMAGAARAHNDANVLCVGADLSSSEEIKKIIEKFLCTEFEAGRHKRRVEQIIEYEKRIADSK